MGLLKRFLLRKASDLDSPEFREMYDAADPSGIPRTAKMVAAYVDGYEWADRARHLFPHATVVTIAVNAADDADVLDVEPGAATIWQVRGWLKRQIARGYYKPTVYCTPSRRLLIIPLTMRVRKDWWIAAWTGRPYTIPGAAAVQYASNRYYDTSLVADPAWPHRKPPHRPHVAPITRPPVRPTPAPAPRGPVMRLDETMVQLHTGKHAETVMALPGGATGVRVAAATTASLVVDYGTHESAWSFQVSFAGGPVDIPLPRDARGRPVRQIKLIRAFDDVDGDVSAAAI